MRYKLPSQDKLFNFATIGIITSVLALSSFLQVNLLADIIAPVVFGVLAALNKVSFDNGAFFNKQGQELTTSLPTKFGEWITILFIIVFVSVITGFISLEYNLFATILVIVLSYFIFIDCPMSILLGEDAWKNAKLVFGIKPAPQDHQDSNLFKHRESLFRKDDLFKSSSQSELRRSDPYNPSSPRYHNHR